MVRMVKASKCHTFGICKRVTSSKQYQPRLYLDNVLVPLLKFDNYFIYLGCHFDFKMTDYFYKNKLVQIVAAQREIIDKLQLHSKNNLKLNQQSPKYLIPGLKITSTILWQDISRYIRLSERILVEKLTTQSLVIKSTWKYVDNNFINHGQMSSVIHHEIYV